MNGKIVLCFAVVLVGQTLGASLFDGEELKKIGEQFTLTATSIGSHFASLVGIPANPADAQKNIDKAKSFVTKGIAELEDQASKLREAVRKQASPTLVEKVDEVEKEIKKHAASAKSFFEDSISKPIDDKYKDDVKKITESIVKTTKEFEGLTGFQNPTGQLSIWRSKTYSFDNFEMGRLGSELEKHVPAVILRYTKPLVDFISSVNIRSFIQNIRFRIVTFFKNIFERFYENSIDKVHDGLFDIPRNIWNKLFEKSRRWKRSINTASYASYDVVPDQDFTPHISEPSPQMLTKISGSLKYLCNTILAPPITLFKKSYIGAHVLELFNIPTDNEQAKTNIEQFKDWMQLQLIKRQYAFMKSRRIIMEKRREQLLAKDFYLVVGTIYEKCMNASLLVYNNCINPAIEAWNSLVRLSVNSVMNGFFKIYEILKVGMAESEF